MQNFQTNKSFSLIDLLKVSLNQFWQNIGLMIACGTIISLVTGGLTLGFSQLHILKTISHYEPKTLLKMLLICAFILIAIFTSIAFTIGQIKVLLEIARRNKSSLPTLFAGFNLSKIIRLLGSTILFVGIMIPLFMTLSVGLVLHQLKASSIILLLYSVVSLAFTLFTLYSMSRFAFVMYFIIDQDQSILESFRSSWKYTQPFVRQIIQYFLLILFVSILTGFGAKILANASFIPLIKIISNVFIGLLFNLVFAHMYLLMTHDVTTINN